MTIIVAAFPSDPCSYFPSIQVGCTLQKEQILRNGGEKGPISQETTTENKDFHLIFASGCIHAPPPTPTTHMYQVSEGELPSALHLLLRLPVESSTILLGRLSMKCQGRCRPASRTGLPQQTGGRAGERRASLLTIQHAPPCVPSAYDWMPGCSGTKVSISPKQEEGVEDGEEEEA